MELTGLLDRRGLQVPQGLLEKLARRVSTELTAPMGLKGHPDRRDHKGRRGRPVLARFRRQRTRKHLAAT